MWSLSALDCFQLKAILEVIDFTCDIDKRESKELMWFKSFKGLAEETKGTKKLLHTHKRKKNLGKDGGPLP